MSLHYNLNPFKWFREIKQLLTAKVKQSHTYSERTRYRNNTAGSTYT
jgi:hypothetical protein